MTPLRRLNETGLSEFSAYLVAAHQNRTLPSPRALLTDPRTSETVRPAVEVTDAAPPTKLEAATTLATCLAPLERSGLEQDRGLWAWLALHWFDGLCPADRYGNRKVLNPAHYVPDPDHRRRYRHLLLAPFQVLRWAPDHNRLWLSGSLASHGDLMEQTVSRLYLLRVPAIRQTMDLLYFDEAAGRIKRGLFGTKKEKPGDIRNRLVKRIQQLGRTYDVQALDAEGLIRLLGDEFARWRTT